MLRLGLCCLFRDEPIKFSRTTAAALGKMTRRDALAKLARLSAANAESLMSALQFCADYGIGCFRVISQILPLRTHPVHGFEVVDLPSGDKIIQRYKDCGIFAAANGLRLCFHPDQFVVLNSQRPEVVEASIRELEYQAEVADWIGADVVNIHGAVPVPLATRRSRSWTSAVGCSVWPGLSWANRWAASRRSSS